MDATNLTKGKVQGPSNLRTRRLSLADRPNAGGRLAVCPYSFERSMLITSSEVMTPVSLLFIFLNAFMGENKRLLGEGLHW